MGLLKLKYGFTFVALTLLPFSAFSQEEEIDLEKYIQECESALVQPKPAPKSTATPPPHPYFLDNALQQVLSKEPAERLDGVRKFDEWVKAKRLSPTKVSMLIPAARKEELFQRISDFETDRGLNTRADAAISVLSGMRITSEDYLDKILDTVFEALQEIATFNKGVYTAVKEFRGENATPKETEYNSPQLQSMESLLELLGQYEGPRNGRHIEIKIMRLLSHADSLNKVHGHERFTKKLYVRTGIDLVKFLELNSNPRIHQRLINILASQPEFVDRIVPLL